jgi:hypothetical protein
LEQEGSQEIVHGYLDTSGVFTTIDVPGSLRTEPMGINDAGEIVGNFTPAPTPEPASLLLFASGLVALGIMNRPKRSTHGSQKN